MKASVFLILYGSFSACMADEPNPFTPQQFRLEQSAPLPMPAQLLGNPPQFRLDLPIGPVRIDYGFPTRKDDFSSGGNRWGSLAA
jgi:hypothetical protein